MLQLKAIDYTIADRILLDEVEWVINPGRRVALVGPNGAGKTTLLRILVGELQPADGTILKPKGYRIGMLPQEEPAVGMGTVLDTVLEGRGEVLEIEHEMHRLQHALAAGDGDQAANLEKLGQLQERFGRLDGYRLEAEAKAVLFGLGFTDEDLHRPMRDLSGGWRMRVHLSRLLLQSPDLLLLDEPTNHLDIPSLEWLERYLRNFTGALVIVSHDRYFIDRLAQEIIELERGRLTRFVGNYRHYEAEKERLKEDLLKRIEAQQAERQRLQRFIDRFRYKASKAAQVQSRVKMLEKMEKLEAHKEREAIRFAIRVDMASYKEVLTVRDLYFRYDRDWVLSGLDLDVFRGEKIALVGINGAGKTTFTRLICGELTPQKGRIGLGERVTTGYYAQHQVDALDLSRSVMQEVEAAAAPGHRARLRDILGVFQFSGDSVDKRVGVLSGGEKARVSLAKILLSPVNFLIMDEPTNHLDIGSREALEHALRDYDGTLLLISHDRYFLDSLVTKVIELKDGRLRVYEGNYTDYLRRRENAVAVPEPPAAGPSTATDEVSADGAPARKSKDQKRREAEARQRISGERKRLEKRIAEMESRIERLEARQTELETLMADPATYGDGDRVKQLQKEHGENIAALETTLHDWEAAQAELETLLASLEK